MFRTERPVQAERINGKKEWITTLVLFSMVDEYPSEDAQKVAVNELAKTKAVIVQQASIDTDLGDIAYTRIDVTLFCDSLEKALQTTVAESLGGLATAGMDVANFELEHAELIEQQQTERGREPQQYRSDQLDEDARQIIRDFQACYAGLAELPLAS
jgi:hypothetical protein